ncbi:MAG TPA: Sir2 family NAD-dependent protein deacetylase, partial [Homoserinimonas sp.]|nr:Sir2 family NAD-dependent protein deacetylase [Homoserinimonas sp.]
STDSGIPGYRGEGSTPRSPMTISQFLTDERYRQRYWAGNQLGWARFGSATPNDGHRSLAALEHAGVVAGVMTQNVDGLHQRAGSAKVVELHGSTDRVRCLACGQLYSRAAIAESISRHNPWLLELDDSALGPDGDVAVAGLDDLVIPDCGVCGGILRPDIVYFGEFIPPAKSAQARGMITSADALLIVGSSLVVNSGIRLLDYAVRRGQPVVIINRGETRGDARATVKIDAGASSTLAALATQLMPERRKDAAQ